MQYIVYTTGTIAIHIFMVRIYFDIMRLALTTVCCDSNILLLTQNISVPSSLSGEIRMCIGTHVYYVPGMVCRPCVINDAQQLRLFSFGFWREFRSFLDFWGEE